MQYIHTIEQKQNNKIANKMRNVIYKIWLSSGHQNFFMLTNVGKRIYGKMAGICENEYD